MKREELEPAYIMLNAYYSKDEADSVMDELEMTLACYEDEVHQLRKQLEDVQNTMATENVDLGMENHKLKERIKELEATQPKWISVKDRLPIECENVVCLEDKWEAMSVCWLTYEEKRWTDGDRDYPLDYYTHWMHIPQPPKSED